MAGDGGTLALGTGSSVNTIQNSGTIQQATGLTDGYSIQEPVNNKASGAKIEVDSATLKFTGADPGSDYTVNQSAGTIAITHGATLYAGAGVTESGGVIKTLGAGTATITTDSQGVKVTAGFVTVGDNTPTVANLAITGNFVLTSGAINIYVSTNTDPSTPSTITVTGSVTINTTGTAMNVYFNGGAFIPVGPLTVMTASGTISNIAASNPTGWTASINGNKNYVLTENP